MPEHILSGRGLDARPDRVDLRDRPYLPPLRSLPPVFPSPAEVAQYLPLYQKDGMILDQGREGACTGFGLAATINYLLWRAARVGARPAEPPPKVSQRMLYHLARVYDEWEGEDYQGSSCRGAMKGWHRHGVCRADLWPYVDGRYVTPAKSWDADAGSRPLGAYYRIDRTAITDMQAAIAEIGAIYVSASVHDGWRPESLVREPNADLPLIGPLTDPSTLGGHAFAMVGYEARGFIVQNSWGHGWGADGFAVMPYEDWVEHGMDAWAVAMGAPMLVSSPHYYPSVALDETASRSAAPGGLLPRGRSVRGMPKRATAPWTQDEAYRHAVVMGNNGIVLNRRITSENALDALEHVVRTAPARFLTGARRDVVLYAHGGLNDEAAAVARARILGPHFERNGAYPIFFVWKTGFLESLGDIAGDTARGIAPQRGWRDGLDAAATATAEARDRAVEIACQRLVVKAVWGQMKQNARAAAHEPRATLDLVAGHLDRLRTSGAELRLHLVGHSAGSILLGHLLDLLLARRFPVATCTLFAPACTVRFALEHYRPATDPARGILEPANTGFEILSDERELTDSVGPYGKSLLYLVSRALEDHHRTPILGMANVWAAQDGPNPFGADGLRDDVKAWQAHWAGGPPPVELSATSVSDGQETIPAAHGSFDNDVQVITRTLTRILGRPPEHAIESLHGF